MGRGCQQNDILADGHRRLQRRRERASRCPLSVGIGRAPRPLYVVQTAIMGHQSAGGSKQPMSQIGGLGQRTPVEISVSSLFQFSSESGSISVCASSVVT